MNTSIRPSAVSGDVDSVVAELIEELANRAQAGEPLDVEAVLAAHPEHAGALRRLLPAVELLAELGRSTGAGSPPPPQSEGDEPPTSGVLGDFRILREVGRGGMAVVYEAEQISLGRRVALKVLPFAATMDPRHLQRFHNEARAAASLHHEHIVPVYAVGQERGVHHYAMQFIEGPTLAAMVADLRQRGGQAPAPEAQPTAPHVPGKPSPPAPAADTGAQAAASTERVPLDRAYFRRVAELGIQAAEALDHAHQMGIVHRDVKPANLLVDARGHLWVTDFGLAQVQSDVRLTMTGDLLGTLRYMSPEQALAQRVVIDHRTDVYSLGATLYELLTLQSAVTGSDRQELLRQIAFEEPKPPRRINKAIPAELETIVLKAIEKNAADRYATAKELADDLRRFLADEPIRARRPSLAQRLRKWGRRHPALVRSAALLLAMAVVGLAISTALIASAKDDADRAYQAEMAQRQRADAAYAAEVVQHQRADAKFEETQAIFQFVVDHLLGQMASEEELGRKITVEEVLANAEREIDEALPSQPTIEAGVRHTLGNAYLKIGKYAAAERHLRLAVEFSQQLGDSNSLVKLKRQHDLADVLVRLNKHEEARKVYEEVLEGRRIVLGEEHKDTLGTMSELASVLLLLGKLDEARALLERVLARHRREEGKEAYVTLAVMQNLAVVREAQGDLVPARKLYEEVLELHGAKFGEKNANQCRGKYNLARVMFRLGERGEAVKLHREAVADLRQMLGENNPETLRSALNLAAMLSRHGAYKEAIDLTDDTRQRCHNVLGAEAYETLVTMNNLAGLLADCPKPELRDPKRAVALVKKAVDAKPEQGGWWDTLGVAYYRNGQFLPAIDALKKASELDRDSQCESSFFLAMAYQRTGESAEARKWYDRAVKRLPQDPENEEELRRYRTEAAELLGIKDDGKPTNKSGAADR